jgi:hypothetical protein
VLGTLAVAIYLVGPMWVRVAYDRFLPPTSRPVLIQHFLSALLVSYLIGVIFSVTLVPTALIRAHTARRRNSRRPRWVAGVLAGALLYLIGSGILEVGSAFYARQAEAIAELSLARPTATRSELRPAGAQNLKQTETGSILILVLGESSARGEPYHPWLSVGQILGWELERVFPWRKVEVDIRAQGGAPLQPNQRILFEEITRRPDAVVIYCGHNEFQSRFHWSRFVPYYVDDFAARPTSAAVYFLSQLTPLCRLINSTIEHHAIALPPRRRLYSELIDRPTCTVDEWSQVLEEFRLELESMVAYCEQLGAIPILIIPAGNDVEFEPSSSAVSPETPKSARVRLAREFEAIRRLERSDPQNAVEAYRRFLGRQPDLAEGHHRLALLLAARGEREEANSHFIKARDLDGMPMRCPSKFQDVYRTVANRHHTVLVDGQQVLGSLTSSGLPDRYVIHDAQHPSLAGYIALAQVALDQLHDRCAFGWPKDAAAPLIDAGETASRAGLNTPRWGEVCSRVATFYKVLASTRYDPRSRLELAEDWRRAEQALRAGAPPETVPVSGLGVHPSGVRELDRQRFRAAAPRHVTAN